MMLPTPIKSHQTVELEKSISNSLGPKAPLKLYASKYIKQSVLNADNFTDPDNFFLDFENIN